MTATLELAKALPAEAANTLLPTALRRSTAHAGEYLSFRIGDEEYALGILNVQEIRRYEVPTRMAGAPACIKGVVNLRGLIVPIIDLRLALGIGEPHDDGFTVVIVLNVLQRVIGVVVDSVSDVVQFKPDQIKPAPAFNGAVDASYLTGLGCIGQDTTQRMLILIDIEALMTSADMGLVSTLSLQ